MARFTLPSLGRIIAALVEPIFQSDDPALYRQAKLLSSLLIALCILLACFVYGPDIGKPLSYDLANPIAQINTGALVLLSCAYVLSRTRYFLISAAITVLIVMLGVFLAVLSAQPKPDTFFCNFLSIVILFSSLFLSLRTSIILIMICIVSMVALPFVAPEISLRQMLLEPISFFVLNSALILLVAYQRNMLEHDRQRALTATATRLQSEVAERMAAELSLRASQSRQRALLDAMPDAMVRLNSEGICLDAKLDLGAYVFQQVPLPGRSLATLMPSTIHQQIHQAILRALESDRIQVVEYNLMRGGARHDFESRIVPSDEAEVVMIVRDITERKKVERMKTEFVSVVSHELRTPLTSIRGALGLVGGGVLGSLTPKIQQMIDIATTNCDRLVRLINDMLDIEKMELGTMLLKRVPVDLVTLIQRAIDDNQSYADQFAVTLHFEPPQQELIANVDPDRMLQVLANLLSNAAKFSSPNGSVRVTLARLQQTLRIAVIDQGQGIPASLHSRIFEKFVQADASDTRHKQGSGLGLNISRAIIQQLGGQIGFVSEEGRGTTFFVDLPIWESLTPKQEAPLVRRRILVSEGNSEVAQQICQMLSQAGFEPTSTSSAVQARLLLDQEHYDGMTLGLTLSDADGISLLRELRAHERTRTLPIVFISAQTDDRQTSIKGHALTIVDWLNKPVGGERLIAAVSQATSQGSTRPRVLHIEDDDHTLIFVSVIVDHVADITAARSLAEAEQLLRNERFDLVLLDLSLPDGSGLEVLPMLYQHSPPPLVAIFSAWEVGPALAGSVAAALVKSRISNHELRDTILALLHQSQELRAGAS